MVKKLVSKAQFARLAGVSSAAITKAIKKNLGAAMIGKRIDINHQAAKKYLESPVQEIELVQGVDPLCQDAMNYCQSVNRFTASAISRHFKTGYARAQRILKMMGAGGVDIPTLPDVIVPPMPKVKAPPPPPVPKVKTPPLPKGVAVTVKTKKQHAIDARANSDNIIHEIPEDIQAFVDMTLRELIQRFGTDAAFLDWLKATKSIEDINEKRLKNAATQGDLVSRQLVKVGVIDPINIVFQKLLTDGAKSITVKVTTMTKAGRDLKECEAIVIDQIASFVRPAKIKMVRNLKNA